MSTSEENSLASAADALAELWERSRSLILSTVDDSGHPEVSYAPFVRDAKGDLYVFVSALAPHTRNLRERPRLSVLIIEDEADARQIFARRRLSCRCAVEWVAREDPGWAPILDVFAARFGDVVAVLRGLADFQLYRLRPIEGRFVLGFGQAYRLSGTRLEDLRPIGPDAG